jgi:Lon protease (S16) C-terminal proteolytic domain
MKKRLFFLVSILFYLPALTFAQAPNTPQEAEVKAVWVRTGATPVTGGTSTVSIRVRPNSSGKAQVFIGGEFPDGTGDMWKAAAWVAAINASNITHTLLHEHEFQVGVNGMIDGPSAGLLFSATMAALIRGDAIRPNVTMTGAISPDGSAGPVGGVVHKIAGAAKEGITVFGYPVGCRLTQDSNTKEWVDIEERAHDIGVEAVELYTVYDAYHLLTGKRLPVAQAISESKLTLSYNIINRLRDPITALETSARKRLMEIERTLRKASPVTRKLTEEHLAIVTSQLQLASQDMNDGNFTLAYVHAQKADYSARSTAIIANLLDVMHSDISEVENLCALQIEDTRKTLEALKFSLKTLIQRQSLGGKVDALHSYIQYWQAMAQLRASEELLPSVVQNLKVVKQKQASSSSKSPELIEAIEKVKGQLSFLAVRWAIAEGRADAARNWASMGSEMGPTVKLPTGLYAQIGDAHSKAASSALAYYNALIIKRAADSANVSEGRAVEVQKQNSPAYAAVSAATNAARREVEKTGSSTAEIDSLDRLASGAYAFIGSSELIGLAYNYQGSGDGALGNRRALSRSLDSARLRVLQECADIEASAGIIPDAIRLNYDLAVSLRDGSDSDRMDALKAFWQCHLLCQITRQIISADTSFHK